MLNDARKVESEPVDYVEFVTTGAPAGRVPLLGLRVRRDGSDDAAPVPDVQRDDLGARALTRRSRRRALDAEERLHLVPRREDHERGHEREHEERHPEADVGAARCALALDPGTAPRPLAPVVALDRERIE